MAHDAALRPPEHGPERPRLSVPVHPVLGRPPQNRDPGPVRAPVPAPARVPAAHRSGRFRAGAKGRKLNDAGESAPPRPTAGRERAAFWPGVRSLGRRRGAETAQSRSCRARSQARPCRQPPRTRGKLLTSALSRCRAAAVFAAPARPETFLAVPSANATAVPQRGAPWQALRGHKCSWGLFRAKAPRGDCLALREAAATRAPPPGDAGDAYTPKSLTIRPPRPPAGAPPPGRS